MLMREDKKKIPVGLIPAGTGDDMCGNLGIDKGDVDTAISYISKLETIKIDCVRVLMDYENQEDLE